MGTDDLFKKAKLQKEKNEKRQNEKMLDSILILTEGEKTEPNYFNGFIRDFRLTNVKIDPTGCNTDTIAKMAIKARKNYSQVWCVFDRDSFKAQNFNRAFQMVEKYSNIYIAYSNEAFELWYLLHFNYYDTAISRDEYIKKLDKVLREKYRKNSMDMYEKLKGRQKKAIQHAKRLLDSYNEFNPNKNKPSTTVFKLVEELNKYAC